MVQFFKIGSLSQVPLGQSKLIEVSGKMIAIFHTKEGWFAIDDRCPHRGGPLSEGKCVEGIITCPWHKAQFELNSGRCLSSSTQAAVKTYPIRFQNGDIEIGI